MNERERMTEHQEWRKLNWRQEKKKLKLLRKL